MNANRRTYRDLSKPLSEHDVLEQRLVTLDAVLAFVRDTAFQFMQRKVELEKERNAVLERLTELEKVSTVPVEEPR